MQVERVKEEGLSRELKITVPLAEINKHSESRLKEVGKTVRLPGFRPGKVPLEILKKRYGRAVLGEVLEKVVQETSSKALQDEGIRPAMQPKIEVQEFDEGTDLTYKMEIEIIPDFEVMDVSGIKLDKPVAKPDPKEVKEALERIAAQNRDSKPIKDDRAIKEGDIVVIDFHGKTVDDGVEHPGMHAHGHKLEIGSGQFIAGFEEQLTGKKVGDEVIVKVSFPKEYQATELAGRDAEFKVDIHAIEEAVDAEINDAFAQKLGLNDVKALEDAVSGQMQAECDNLSRMKVKRQLLDILDENHSFDIPQQMWDAEYNSIIHQVEHDQGGKAEDISDEDKEELKEIANRRVRLGLILSNIGNKNNIQVTDQELQQAVIREAQHYPGQERQVFDLYQQNPQALDGLRAPVFEDKVVDFILQQVTITEKDVDLETLRADDDDEAAPKKPAAKKKSTKAKSAKADDKEEKPNKKSTAKKSASKPKAKKDT